MVAPIASFRAAPLDGGECEATHEPPAPSATGPRSALNVAALAGALHEVSNALTVVVGWIERAREGGDAGDQRELALAIAGSRAMAARDLVRRAIGAEVAPESPRPVAEIVAEAALGLEPEALRGGVRLRSEVGPWAEAELVEHGATVVQILTNLLLNALSVAPPGSTVTIDATLEEARHAVRIGVTDEGPGVPEDRRESLFVSGLSTRVGGAGIGLRHAAALAHAHGGELTLAAEEERAPDFSGSPPEKPGARFELQWPRVEGVVSGVYSRRSSTPTPQPASRFTELDGVRILVVEDDAAVIDLLELALTARGADVVSAHSAAELAEALERGPFDAVLLDLSPIREDARAAVAAVRAASPSARVIVISGTVVDTSTVPDAWIAAWVRKPFEVSEIVQAVRAPIAAQAGLRASG